MAGWHGPVERDILRKLYLAKYIGGKHTAIESLSKGVPSHSKGDYEKAAKGLIKARYLLPKINGYGLHVSIDPRAIPAILQELVHRWISVE
jgi:hypothetical protein